MVKLDISGFFLLAVFELRNYLSAMAGFINSVCSLTPLNLTTHVLGFRIGLSQRSSAESISFRKNGTFASRGISTSR